MDLISEYNFQSKCNEKKSQKKNEFWFQLRVSSIFPIHCHWDCKLKKKKEKGNHKIFLNCGFKDPP